MATLTIKNIPEDLYRRLKGWAARNRRSINSEVIVCLEAQLASRPVDPEAFLARVDALHDRARPVWLTEDMIREARETGRP